MKRPLLPRCLLYASLALICGIIGWGWLRTTPSFEELYGGIARTTDYFRGMASVSGWPWWTPNYLFGHSHSLFGVNFLILSILQGFALALSKWVTAVTAYKIAGLGMIFLGGLAMGSLVRRLVECEWTGLFCGILYASSAQFALRLAQLEHFTTAACLVLAPAILLGILYCEKEGSWKSSVLLALGVAAMALSYIKIFILFLPALGVFFLWRFFHADLCHRRRLLSGVVRGAGITVILGLLPLLPTLRESKWIALFELEPLAGWQQTYSFFTGLAWLDFNHWLTLDSGLGAFSDARHLPIEFYTGPLIIGGILIPLLMVRRQAEWLKNPTWSVFRLFTALMLVATWLCSGPKSLIQSHFAFLSMGLNSPNSSIALSWFILFMQGVIIYHLWAGAKRQAIWATLSLIIYFGVPGFRLLEGISLYQNIRAPSSIWTAFGALSAVIAAGAGWKLLSGIAFPRWIRLVAAIAIPALFIADFAYIEKSFYRSGLSSETFTEFEAVEHVLATREQPGRVYPLSGRYFYLATPLLSDRSLSTEALCRHFQFRWIRYMEGSSQSSSPLLKTFFRFYGISYLLIDRQDPDTPRETQDYFKSLFPTVFENAHFTLLENSKSLYPAYLAEQILQAPENSYLVGPSLLSIGQYGYVSVESSTGEFIGKIDKEGKPDIPLKSSAESIPLKNLKLTAPRNQNYHEFTVTGIKLDKPWGVVVVTEAYHPDWQAWQNGKQLTVSRAMGALLSVAVEKNDDVVFRFVPPWWYNACMTTSLGGWVACFLLVTIMPICPRKWREWWLKQTSSAVTAVLPAQSSIRGPVQTLLVIIPSWNEAESIVDVIEKTLGSTSLCEILVVDDGSPDGTAGIVRLHREFGKRLHLIERKNKSGLGSAYKAGFEWAMERHYDACVEMDADCSHDPADIPRLVKTLTEGADVAIGSRYLGGVRVLNWPQHRLFLSTGASNYVRFLIGMPLTDPTSGFKAIRNEALRSLDWSKFRAEGYGFQIELHYFLWIAGYRMVEVPIVFTERSKGHTKMSLGIAVEAAWRVIQLAVRRKRP